MFMVNVGKYTIHGSYGYGLVCVFLLVVQKSMRWIFDLWEWGVFSTWLLSSNCKISSTSGCLSGFFQFFLEIANAKNLHIKLLRNVCRRSLSRWQKAIPSRQIMGYPCSDPWWAASCSKVTFFFGSQTNTLLYAIRHIRLPWPKMSSWNYHLLFMKHSWFVPKFTKFCQRYCGSASKQRILGKAWEPFTYSRIIFERKDEFGWMLKCFNDLCQTQHHRFSFPQIVVFDHSYIPYPFICALRPLRPKLLMQQTWPKRHLRSGISWEAAWGGVKVSVEVFSDFWLVKGR